MSPNERNDLLIEATLGTHRTRDAEGLPAAPPEWWDLTSEGRAEVFRRQLSARRIESAMDERGWSGTVKAVLARL